MIADFFQQVLKSYDPSLLLKSHYSIGGGCIHHATKLESDRGSFFVKWNSESEKDLFIAESEGLTYLRTHSLFMLPKVFQTGTYGDKSFLLMEWIDSTVPSKSFWIEFGQLLADLHRHTSNQYGFEKDNFIGRLRQQNNRHTEWVDFFIHERLIPQITLGAHARLIDAKMQRQFEIFFTKLNTLVPSEAPSLLHGDLWSGNFLVSSDSRPVLIDPASHYGHRETELAFTHLFGGFDELFYKSYQECYPLSPGFEERIEIHNLYPLLVHLNLFGVSYLSGIGNTLNKFTS